MKAAPNLFLTLSAYGVEDIDQRSRSRRAVMLASAVLLLCAPLAWAATAEGSVKAGPDAVLSKPVAQASDDDDDSGGGDSGGGGRNSESGADTGGGNTGNTGGATTGDGNTAAGNAGPASDATGGDVADSRTRGVTADLRDRATGHETVGNTDFPARADTGVSTVGETDPGDLTGPTERR